MKITKESKDSIATLSAVFMLLFGATLSAIGFAVEPVGKIDDSVLWVLGQSLLYSGGIFGVTLYTKHRFDEIESRMRRYMPPEQNQSEEEPV